MASPPSGTFETYAAIGNLDDLSEVIYNISPDDTPFLSGAEITDAIAVLHEWQIDSLAAASGSNAVEEGLDASTDTVTATVRPSNTCQISDKVPRVSGTQQAVAKAGRGDELEYQIAKMGSELKRDMETSLLANTAEVGGSSGTARVLGGIETWIGTNTSVGAGGGTNTNGNSARTTGTNRDFTEDQLKEVLRECWVSGGDPDVIMVGGYNKQVLSGFTGNATKTVELGGGARKLEAAIDVYASDFGKHYVYPNRFQNTRTCLVLQMDLWAVAFLRQFQVSKLAKTGDSERAQLLVEFTLEARNEAGSGAVYDLNNGT